MNVLFPLTSFTHYIKKYYYRKKYRRQYYSQFVIEEDVVSLMSLFENSSPILATTENISYNNIEFGWNEKQINHKLGKPRYSFSISMLTATHKARVFVKKVHGCSIMIYCHFLDGQLFMVQSVIDEPVHEIGSYLKLELEKKYNCQLNSDECWVVDKHENRLMFSTSPTISTYVISGSSVFKNKLLREMNSKPSQQVKNKQLYNAVAKALV